MLRHGRSNSWSSVNVVEERFVTRIRGQWSKQRCRRSGGWIELRHSKGEDRCGLGTWKQDEISPWLDARQAVWLNNVR